MAETKNRYTHKEKLSTLALISAIGFGIAGTWIPPTGIIDHSMLYLIAQLLIFAATLLGFGEALSKMADLIGQLKSKKDA